MARKRDILASSRKIRRKRFFLRAALSLILFLFLLGGFAGLLYIPKFRIQKISIQGNSTLNKEEIASNVSKLLNGRYFGIFPRDNILIFPKEEISNNLLNVFSRIKNVSLDSDFPNSLFIEIKERKPTALFCEEVGCSFIDEDGFVFEDAAFFSGNVYVKFYDEVNKDIESINRFNDMMNFTNLASEENIKITSIVLAEDGLLKFFTAEGWHIMMNENENIQNIFENLKLSLSEQIKEDRSNLEYIDLRFGNKVYYKFK